jgi:hypothetical protein
MGMICENRIECMNDLREKIECIKKEKRWSDEIENRLLKVGYERLCDRYEKDMKIIECKDKYYRE